jgi:hypothetical protein|tara:strand:- start:3803 stop:4069 length:267 start_codon:yes stop_codon:yes gene_type:complete
MAKLIFTYTDKDYIEHNREVSKIELDMPDDMDIHEFKVVCVRLASTIGYTNKSITKAFGDLIYGEDSPNSIKELLDELNINTDKKTKR